MNSPAFVTLMTYRTVPEAAIAQAALTSHGVAAHLENTETATMAPHRGKPSDVRLLVAAQDADQAATILRAILFADASASAAPWTCPNCGASVDAGFDACWSCGMLKGESSATPPASL
jgi:hypothetical protein